MPIPMPPAEGGVEGEEPPAPPNGEGEAGMGGEDQFPGDEELPAPEGMESGPEAGAEGPPAEGEDLDQLPAPPVR